MHTLLHRYQVPKPPSQRCTICTCLWLASRCRADGAARRRPGQAHHKIWLLRPEECKRAVEAAREAAGESLHMLRSVARHPILVDAATVLPGDPDKHVCYRALPSLFQGTGSTCILPSNSCRTVEINCTHTHTHTHTYKHTSSLGAQLSFSEELFCRCT